VREKGKECNSSWPQKHKKQSYESLAFSLRLDTVADILFRGGNPASMIIGPHFQCGALVRAIRVALPAQQSLPRMHYTRRVSYVVAPGVHSSSAFARTFDRSARSACCSFLRRTLNAAFISGRVFHGFKELPSRLLRGSLPTVGEPLALWHQAY